jgi:arginyl-tRNA synthetase
MVRMVEDGQEVKMSKRTGNAITIRELCEDVGVDAARWFFVSKDVATHMDFDMNTTCATSVLKVLEPGEINHLQSN